MPYGRWPGISSRRAATIGSKSTPRPTTTPAIRCYQKVGFQPVGLRRRAERGLDGTWHDVLLMDLVAEELADPD